LLYGFTESVAEEKWQKKKNLHLERRLKEQSGKISKEMLSVEKKT
jgi:hypothetical protein